MSSNNQQNMNQSKQASSGTISQDKNQSPSDNANVGPMGYTSHDPTGKNIYGKSMQGSVKQSMGGKPENISELSSTEKSQSFSTQRHEAASHFPAQDMHHGQQMKNQPGSQNSQHSGINQQ
jgi:hypothetical protein